MKTSCILLRLADRHVITLQLFGFRCTVEDRMVHRGCIAKNIYIYYFFGWGCFDSDIVSPVLLCFHANNGELNRNKKNRNRTETIICEEAASRQLGKNWTKLVAACFLVWISSLNFSWSTTCSFMCWKLWQPLGFMKSKLVRSQMCGF